MQLFMFSFDLSATIKLSYIDKASYDVGTSVLNVSNEIICNFPYFLSALRYFSLIIGQQEVIKLNLLPVQTYFSFSLLDSVLNIFIYFLYFI